MVRCIPIRLHKICLPRTGSILRKLALLAVIMAVVWFFQQAEWIPLAKKKLFAKNESRSPESSSKPFLSSLLPTSTSLPTSLPKPGTTLLESAVPTSDRLFLSSLLPTPSSFLLTSAVATPDRRSYLSQRDQRQGSLGQGNLMFMYAALLGIANQTKMIPVYPADGPLRKIFNITASSLSLPEGDTIPEAKACSFDSKLFSVGDRNRNVTVVGYLQSWKYFSAIEDQIRREFTPNEQLKVAAQEFLRSTLHGRNTLIPLNDAIYIGVHIRRQDMMANYNIARGYAVATKEYLVKAVDYFKSNYSGKLLTFVVCSDDRSWSKENFPASTNDYIVAFSENRTAAMDMAILASCNHSIVTVGSFGWWGAYLAGGSTVYYKNFPTPGTFIDGILKKEDYFPPNWIPMS